MANVTLHTAARTALKRKKAHEHSLEQTSNQITMLENQIYSIESANINQETLNAMRNAGKAMKDIHGNLSIDKVDAIMCVFCPSQLMPLDFSPFRVTLD